MTHKPAYINEPDAIVYASGDGDGALVEQLLNSGANINVQNNHGETALIAAADAGYLGIVELLVTRGADVNATDSDGDTALDIALFNEHILNIDTGIASFIKHHGGKRRTGPSAKQKREDAVYDAFQQADAVKMLLSKIHKTPKNS